MTKAPTGSRAARLKLPGSIPADLDQVLSDFVRLTEDGRAEFLSIFAHSLTVDIRAALLDRPVPNEDAARAYEVNEWLHQLTSCLNPGNRRGAKAEAELLSDIAADSSQNGLERAVARAMTAASNAFLREREGIVA